MWRNGACCPPAWNGMRCTELNGRMPPDHTLAGQLILIALTHRACNAIMARLRGVFGPAYDRRIVPLDVQLPGAIPWEE
jgi:hypothetical protein